MLDDPRLPDTLGDDPLAARLTALRPVPGPAYRGALRRRLVALGPPAARPPRLKTLAAAYALAGLVLLVIGVASIAGIGPLAA